MLMHHYLFFAHADRRGLAAGNGVHHRECRMGQNLAIERSKVDTKMEKCRARMQSNGSSFEFPARLLEWVLKVMQSPLAIRLTNFYKVAGSCYISAIS